MISLDRVSKSFDGGHVHAVREVSLHIEEGQTLVLLGSSGCGKTTTLRMINRLIDPTEGTIRVDERDVMQQDPIALRRSIGYVFQDIGLFEHMRIWENVSIVLRLMGQPRRQRRQRADELLELVELPPGDYGDRYPAELSGGQQQRVAVARALAADPGYLLMDEPFGALDAITRDVLQKALIELRQRLNKTIVFVTHDIFEALTLADRIAVMHEGRLEQEGTVRQLAEHPATGFVEELFGKPAQQLAVFKERTT